MLGHSCDGAASEDPPASDRCRRATRRVADIYWLRDVSKGPRDVDLPDIDFTRIRSGGPAGQREGFEQFVAELAAEDPPADGATFVRIDGAGGDGGVECFWTLPDGSEEGWQAKYWTGRDQVDKGQLDNSVKVALEIHPRLTHYKVSIPVDPSGPTAREGKSLLEKINGDDDEDGWLDGWHQMAADRDMEVTFEVVWRTDLITRLQRLPGSDVRTRYWFDVTVLADRWWQERLDEAIASSRPRYTPELSIRVRTSTALDAICGDAEWTSALRDLGARLEACITDLERDAPDAAGADLEAVAAELRGLATAWRHWSDGHTADSRRDLETRLDAARTVAVTAERAEADAMTARHGGGWDSVGWRQFQAEYQVSFPAAPVDTLRSTIEHLDELASAIARPFDRLPGASVAAITGAAGSGKTFVTCDHVAARLGAGNPSLLVHGRWFGEGDLLRQLRDRLQLPADLTGAEVLGLLDQAGRSAGAPVLLVVDALNETRPRRVWFDNLEQISAMVDRHHHLRLVITVRTHYRPQTIPDGLDIPVFEHRGYGEAAFDAMREYADYYGLEPPVAPPVNGEFDNPLFLRLVCEAMQSQGRHSLAQADVGLGSITALLLDAKNRDVSLRLGAPEPDRVAHQAMDAIAEAIGEGGTSTLDREEARRLTAEVWADQTVEGSLLEALISEGLLAEDYVADGTGPGLDLVAIAFERLGDHLIVSRCLNALATIEELQDDLANGGLRALLDLDAEGDPGLLEALSVAVAERFDIELTGLDVADDLTAEVMLGAIVAGLGWRTADTITESTRRAVVSALEQRSTFKETMNRLFALSVKPDHALNADWLSELLSVQSMVQRDRYLVPFLHYTHDTDGAVDRLVEWARTSETSGLRPETCRLWATALLWCAGSSDRRIRDHATVGAARILARHPGVVDGLLAAFLPVDDDWIVERALLVGYSALLRSGDTTDWSAVAQRVYDDVFAVDAPANASIRDAARSIIEAAEARGALPDGVVMDNCRPPYDSAWPIDWPDEQDLEPFHDQQAYPRLVHSCTTDDFFIYQIQPLVRDIDEVDPAAVGCKVVVDVADLGYDPEAHGRFDSYLVYTFGGGRGKPAWIERISKKYQWVVLSRLLGVIRDHTQPTPRSWEVPRDPSDPQAIELRDLDPTLCEPARAKMMERAWVPGYNWASRRDEPHEQWVADDDDLPEIGLAPAGDPERPQVVLDGYYEWRGPDRSDGADRRIWTLITSLLVPSTSLGDLLSKLESRNLAGDTSVQAPTVTGGYVGDYPYGLNYRRALAQIEHDAVGPVPAIDTFPSTLDLLGDYEYAPGGLSRVSVGAPSPLMFDDEPGRLRWDGRDTWWDGGVPAARARHTDGRGNELIVDADWLLAWLSDSRLALVWTELSGKDVVIAGPGTPGRLLRTRVRYLDGGTVHALPPVLERLPPRDGTLRDSSG